MTLVISSDRYKIILPSAAYLRLAGGERGITFSDPIEGGDPIKLRHDLAISDFIRQF